MNNTLSNILWTSGLLVAAMYYGQVLRLMLTLLPAMRFFIGKTVLLIDDVANSGKTMLYAMKPFLNFQPRTIQTLVLVGRSHNSFPIHPDYIGLSIATTLQEHIFVEVTESGIGGAFLA